MATQAFMEAEIDGLIAWVKSSAAIDPAAPVLVAGEPERGGDVAPAAGPSMSSNVSPSSPARMVERRAPRGMARRSLAGWCSSPPCAAERRAPRRMSDTRYTTEIAVTDL
jgi:hypothetical protein